MRFRLSLNAPCPCNSGEKYKKCCLGSLTSEQEEYYGLLSKENRIKKKFLEWFSEYFDGEEIDDYCYDFDKKDFETLEYKNDAIFFFDWFFLEAFHKKEKKKILEIIFSDYSHLFDDDELEIIKAWLNNTQAGIYEILEKKEDDWKVLIKEIFTNREYSIVDREASKHLIKGDIFFARVQKVFSEHYISGAAKTYPRLNVAEQLKSFVTEKYEDAKKKDKDLTYERFMNKNSKILNEFVPNKPKFITRGGEEVKFCEASYHVDLKNIEKILDWFDGSEDFIINSVEKEKGFESADITYIRKGERSKENYADLKMFSEFTDEKGNKVDCRGSINIKKDELKIFSTSEKAYEELKRLLKDNLQEYVIFEKEDIKSTDEILDEEPEEEEEEEDEKEEISKEDLKDLEQDFLKKYYKSWCDKKIPALNNKTPRQSIKTKEGRKLLKKLLLDIENMEQHKAREEKNPFDCVNFIRKELDFYE